MIDLNKIMFSFLLSTLLLFGSANAQSQYDFRGYMSSLDVSELGITFNYSGGTCDAQMSSRNTFTTLSGSFDSTVTWKSPDAFTMGFATLSGLSNTSCLSYGTTSLKSINVDATSGYFESSWDVSHSADSGFVNTMTRYFCDSTTDRTNFFISNGSDSRGNCLYGTRTATSNQRIAFLNTLTTNYNRCGDLTEWSNIEDCSIFFGASCSDCQKTSQYIYPINSSATGDVIYNITDNFVSSNSTATQGPGTTFAVDIINTETGTITNLHSTTVAVIHGTPRNFLNSGTLSLSADTLYLLVLTFNATKSGGVFYSFVTHGPSINFSIFTFRPDYVCGPFGECINSSQSRVCVDSLGVAPDRIETRSCFDVPADTVNLGFEAIRDLIPEFIYTCQKDWTLITCIDILATIPARFPVNWTISADLDRPGGGYRQNYIRISDDTATVGTKSLKMNYIPPKLSEPISDPGNASLTICGNKTEGDFPFVTTGLNQSLYVSRNISFPSPFIQIRLDSRKCSEQILQYDYTSGIYSLCDIVGIQRKLCYATNCSEEPDGNYRIGVFDAQTLDQIVEFSDVAINSWTSHIIDLSNAGLIVNHNYTIIIVVNPLTESGVYDPNSHCVYFDNFRVTITETALPECTTRCEGFDLLLANQNGDICFFTQITNSPACAPDQSTAEAFQDFDTVCIGTTLHFFNNVTGLWDQTTNSDICIEAINETAQQIEDTQPLSDITSYISFFEFIFSPIFIYFIFALIISGILSAGIARITDNGDGVFQVFGVTMMIFVLLGSLPGIAVIPIWISIAIIAVISLLIAQKLRGFGFPGGGG